MASSNSKKSSSTALVYKPFRGYGFVGDDVVKRREVMKIPRERMFMENTLFGQIFAPDVITGNPASDLYLRKTADPEIKEFIDKQLTQRMQNDVTNDMDLALESAKSKYETRQAYADRLRAYLAATDGNNSK